MSAVLYEKAYARDFALATIQLWYCGEASDPRQYTEKQQPHHPYTIFWRNQNTVNIFVDKKGIDWIKSEITRLIARNPEFPREVAERYEHSFDELEDILEVQRTLTLEELRDFASKVRDSWVWFEALWFTIELFEHTGRTDGLDHLLAIRKKTEDITPFSDAVLRKSIAALYPSVAQYAHVLLLEEIFGNNVPSIDILKQRAEGYIYTDNRLFEVSQKERIEEEFNIRICEPESTERIFKGQTAYKGVVRGRVRRLFGVTQLSEFQEGEILVASSTTPDLLPAMKKAAAFISDEGGIICHAAIVARELKKPCVIGTRTAMDSLSDGDLVEVDADNGIIRVLNAKLST